MSRDVVFALACLALMSPAAADVATRDEDGILVIQSLEERRLDSKVPICRIMSCEDAVRLQCRVYTRQERAALALPCEGACKSKAQADAIKAGIDC